MSSTDTRTIRDTCLLTGPSVAALALGCCGAVPAWAELAPALRSAMQLNLDAYNRKNVDAMMGTVDSHSPDYVSTKKAIEEQFKGEDVTTELVDVTYIGHDDEFAVARNKTKTTSKPGSGFTDNVVDAILVFHQENGDWKLWSEQILGVDILP